MDAHKPIRQRLLTVLAMLAVLVYAAWVSDVAYAQTPSPNNPSSGELVEEPNRFDGTTLTFTGEVIGEAMDRGDMAWIHINDDSYYLENVEEGARLGGYNSGHAVWIPEDQLSAVAHYGDYRHEGDVVTVRGTFNAACAEHGGDMDIHAVSLSVDVPGRDVVDEVKPAKAATAAILGLLAALLFLIHRARGRASERGTSR